MSEFLKLNEAITFLDEDDSEVQAKVIGIDAYECNTISGSLSKWTSFTLEALNTDNPLYKRFWIVDHTDQDIGINVWLPFEGGIDETLETVDLITGEIINKPVAGDTIASGTGNLKVFKSGSEEMLSLEEFYEEDVMKEMRFRAFPLKQK